jgi:hypothetical protein
MHDLASLDARSFHAHLADLLRAEFVSQGAFLVALAEFDGRGSFRDLGYASLFEYLHRGLKLSRVRPTTGVRRPGWWDVSPKCWRPSRMGGSASPPRRSWRRC